VLDPLDDPLRRLAADRANARAANDPMAALCILATVDALGQPSARTLVLRELGSRLALFMNSTSPKFNQLSTGKTSICIYMPSIQVQYRAVVTLLPVERALIAESWQLRPHMPKVLDWFYSDVQPQSTAVDSRAELKTVLGSLLLPDPLVAPETACGFYLEPREIERLDLSHPDGLHDRVCWTLSGKIWSMETRVP
jgi:pyridoxine/pyridoxamine 5'-phosphate oxidase